MTNEQEKLKPCPFCGGPVQLETVKSRAGTLYGVVCRNTGNRGCTCAMEQVPSRTAEAAIARWNMRKPMEDLAAENDAVLREATSLAMTIWRTTYAQAVPEFEPFDKASSIITQIDNMVAGIMQERDRLKRELAQMTQFRDNAANHMRRIRGEATEFEKERDALRKDAERYRWLRDSSESIHQFYLSTPIWFTGVKFSGENVDSTIDAAMAQEVQP